jgi:zinc protease
MMKKYRVIIALFTLSASTLLSANTFKTIEWKTSQGTPVIFFKAMEVPMLDVSIAFRAGSAYDGTSFGLSALTNHLLNQGSFGKDAHTLTETLEQTGAQYEANVNRDMAVLSLRTLTNQEALTQSLNVFAQYLAHPDFPKNTVIHEKNQMLMAIQQAQESPDETANMTFFQSLYQNHPYAHSINGTKATISALDRESVLKFYKQYYVANNAYLVLVGAIDEKEAHTIADMLTKDLPKGIQAPPIPKATSENKNTYSYLPFSASQTTLRLGQLSINHSSPNYFPLMVGNYILGAGAMVSRLSLEVREKHGLTYGVHSQFIPLSGLGPFLVTLSTRNKQAEKALELTKAVLSQFIEQGPNDTELAHAKQYLSGSFRVSLASNRAIASSLLKIAFYGLPNDYLETYVKNIEAATKDQIKTAFQKELQVDKMLVVRVGPK